MFCFFKVNRINIPFYFLLLCFRNQKQNNLISENGKTNKLIKTETMKKNLLPKLDWDIQTESVYLKHGVDSGKKVIYRSDNHKMLSMVGKQYTPISNEQLMAFIEALTRSGEFDFKGFDELNDGKIILAFLKNTNPYLKINGCENEEYMFIGNSFDGTKSFHIGTASTLIRCENQFSSTLKVFTKKHTSYINLNETIANEIIQDYKIKKSTIYEAFDGMENIRVDEPVIDRLIKEIYDTLSKDSAPAKEKDWTKSPSMHSLKKAIYHEMEDLGNNAFGLFNGVTFYTTHKMRSTDVLTSQINGTAYQINQKAFRFCKTLKRNYKISI